MGGVRGGKGGSGPPVGWRHDRVSTAAPAAAKLEVDDPDNSATPCATTVAVQLCDPLASVYIGQIFFFENKAALDQFTSGNVEFGADVSASTTREWRYSRRERRGDGPSHGGRPEVLIQRCRSQLTVYLPGPTDFRPLRLQPKLAIDTVNQLLVICLAYVNVRA